MAGFHKRCAWTCPAVQQAVAGVLAGQQPSRQPAYSQQSRRLA